MTYITGRDIPPAWFDDPALDGSELQRRMRWQSRLNRMLGGAAAVIARLSDWTRDWPADEPIRIIDLGTGAADIPLAMVEWAARAGLEIRITAVEQNASILAIARQATAGQPAIELLEADARHLMDHYSAHAFDFAHAGLLLHHYSDVEVMTVMRIMDRLAARGVVVNDLLRGSASAVGAWLTSRRIDPSHRRQAMSDVRAGFTRREVLDLARRVGLEQPRFRRHHCFRFTLTSTKTAD